MFGPRLKVERANYHIDQFEALFRAYIKTNLKFVFPKGHNNKRRKHAYRMAYLGTPAPRHAPTVIGDAIHNLRTSLDHMYCRLVEANKGVVTKRTKFPFGEDRKSIEGSLNGQKSIERPSQDAIAFILDSLEPFSGGALSLYELHQLDIVDKHHLFLDMMIGFGIDDGLVLEQFDAAGVRRMSFSQLTINWGYNPKGGFAATDGHFEFNGDASSAFEVLFGEGAFKGKHIIQTMRALSQNVSGALDALEVFL